MKALNQLLKIKLFFLFLSALIILTIGICAIQIPTGITDNVTPLSASSNKITWQRTYGGTEDDRLFCTVQSGDGYLVVGSTRSIVPNTTVGWVLKLDGEGNAIWNKTFLEGSGTELRFAANLSDGFLIVGNEFSSSGDINGYVAKIDNKGTLLWRRIIDGENGQKLFSAILDQKYFVLLGSSFSIKNGDSQAWIVKIDLNGTVIWNKTYGNATNTVARKGVLAPDGDYMVAGYTNPQGLNNYNFLLMKIDQNGNLIWEKTYYEKGTQEAYSIVNAYEGYILVGDTQSQGSDINARVMKVDINGDIQWVRTVGGQNADSPSYITATKDEGYLVTGFTISFGAGNRDLFLFKINDSGEILWSCTQGDLGYQESYSVIESGKNQYVISGWTDPPNEPSLIGKAHYDFYLVEINTPQNKNDY